MFFRILKKDLKRKKTMNIILFLFIILATMFVASGINNVITVMNGTNYYLDKAGIKDFIIITMGSGEDDDSLENMVQGEETISDYAIEDVIYGSSNNIFKANGKAAKTKNAVILQELDKSALKFFDSKNEEVKSVPPGHAYVSGSFMKENNLSVGDKIIVKHENVTIELVLDGKVKDALLGSDMMGNTRIFINERERELLLSDENIKNFYLGKICYIETSDTSAVKAAASDVSNVSFAKEKSVIKTCYVMDMIVAFIILIMSICLILVSFVVLKFSITFTIREEFREIGVMKAIGIKNFKIRSLYISKYLMLAVVGAVLGLVFSIPFGNMLIKSVSENMVLGNSIGYLSNVIGAIVVIIIILLFAFKCTGRVKKMSPIDAVRSGQTGERFKKKAGIRIGKMHGDNSLFFAINDILSSPKRFATIIISFFMCTLFVLILVNTTETMDSEKLIHTFGSKSDLYVTDVGDFMKYMKGGTKEELLDHFKKYEEELDEAGMPASMCIDIQYKYTVYVGDKKYSMIFQQGLNTKSSDYVYSKGEVPQNANEIAITKFVSKELGIKIGDKVTIDFGNEKMDCIVVAYFESMNQLGEVIRLHEEAPTSMEYASSAMSYQINFLDNPSKKEIERRKETVEKIFNTKDVSNTREYCVDCISVVGTMKRVQYLLLGITLVVVFLVTILMERSFIADEKSQIAMLKAIGFSDKKIIMWQINRFGIVALTSVLLAAAVSMPMTRLCINPIFGMMGATEIDYNFVLWKIFLMYPIIVFLVTIFVATITALYTRKIKSSDTQGIE